MVDHHQGVGHLQRLLLVVGDEDRGHLNLVVQPSQPVPQFLAHLGIQRAERLVEQKHLRFHRQRPSQCHPLALATGQLGRHPVGEL